MSIPADLAAARYISLTTYRRNGTPVATPVWLAPDGDRLVVWTNPGTGKVKRLRHTSRVQVSVCNMSGRIPEDAPRYEATAHILGDEDGKAARGALLRRYLPMRVADWFTRLVPRLARPGIGIAIVFASDAASA